MKHSQMVEEIRKILEMNGVDNGYSELEEALLHTIEHFGMLPPAVKVPCPTHYIDATGLVKQGEDSFVFVNEWEKEDEAH